MTYSPVSSESSIGMAYSEGSVNVGCMDDGWMYRWMDE